MAKRTLTTSYLVKLSNANHDGVTQQILDRCQAAETDNAMLTQAIASLATKRQAEDAAFKRFSGKDFASEDLKREDRLEDQYMSVIRGLLNAYTLLPETEPLRRKAEVAVQVFKDFQFSINDGFEAEARKTVNMVQEWSIAGKYETEALGIKPWIEKADAQAKKVLALITQRVDTESAKVKGELAEARKQTDAAVRQVFEVINALTVLQPSEALTGLVSVLFGIEDRAKLYYISGGKTSGGEKPSTSGTTSGGTSTEGGENTGGSEGGDDDGPSGVTEENDNPGGNDDNPPIPMPGSDNSSD